MKIVFFYSSIYKKNISDTSSVFNKKSRSIHLILSTRINVSYKTGVFHNAYLAFFYTANIDLLIIQIHHAPHDSNSAH